MSGLLSRGVVILLTSLSIGATGQLACSAEHFEIRRAESEPAEVLKEAAVEGEEKKVYLHAKADLTGKDLLHHIDFCVQEAPLTSIITTMYNIAKTKNMKSIQL